jgi:hypothetical protein
LIVLWMPYVGEFVMDAETTGPASGRRDRAGRCE